MSSILGLCENAIAFLEIIQDCWFFKSLTYSIYKSLLVVGAFKEILRSFHDNNPNVY